MNLHDNKSQENESRAIANNDNTQKTTTPVAQFVDNRPEAVAQLKLQEGIKESNGTEPVQMMEGGETEAPALQGGAAPNNTGLPDNLKAGIEKLSGLSMDDVKVHYNSDKPEQLGALAYAQGTDIYIGPGQEEHLAHEAWHVVQQKEGRVAKTMQLKGGVGINDDSGLEKEADVMGEKALDQPINPLEQVAQRKLQGNPEGIIQYAKGKAQKPTSAKTKKASGDDGLHKVKEFVPLDDDTGTSKYPLTLLPTYISQETLRSQIEEYGLTQSWRRATLDSAFRALIAGDHLISISSPNSTNPLYYRNKDSLSPREALLKYIKNRASGLFTPDNLDQELGNLDWGKSTIDSRKKNWIEDKILFAYQSSPTDQHKKLTFDVNLAGERAVNPGNRDKYGYHNPKKDSELGLKILALGLHKKDNPKFKKNPKLATNKNWMKNKAIFRCVRTGKRINYDEAILGHQSNMGASDHWNELGHKQTYEENHSWNTTLSSYGGPEDRLESASTGAASAKYLVPSKELGSHESWYS